MLVGEGCWGGVERFIQDQPKSHPPPGGVLAEPMIMTHSGMLYKMDYELVLFQIFVPWKFIKTYVLP